MNLNRWGIRVCNGGGRVILGWLLATPPDRRMETDPSLTDLVEELKGIREVLTETHQDIQHLTRNIQDYLSAIADSSDQIREEILARIRYDELPKPLLPPEETVTCAHCDASADSLADAVRNGFTRLQPDPDGLSWNYLGECSECAAKMNHAPKQQGLF